jgi:hypothetical protein
MSKMLVLKKAGITHSRTRTRTHQTLFLHTHPPPHTHTHTLIPKKPVVREGASGETVGFLEFGETVGFLERV